MAYQQNAHSEVTTRNDSRERTLVWFVGEFIVELQM